MKSMLCSLATSHVLLVPLRRGQAAALTGIAPSTQAFCRLVGLKVSPVQEVTPEQLASPPFPAYKPLLSELTVQQKRPYFRSAAGALHERGCMMHCQGLACCMGCVQVVMTRNSGNTWQMIHAHIDCNPDHAAACQPALPRPRHETVHYESFRSIMTRREYCCRQPPAALCIHSAAMTSTTETWQHASCPRCRASTACRCPSQCDNALLPSPLTQALCPALT